VAAPLAFAAGAVNGFIFNRRWTFAARDSTRARVLYVTVQVTGPVPSVIEKCAPQSVPPTPCTTESLPRTSVIEPWASAQPAAGLVYTTAVNVPESWLPEYVAAACVQPMPHDCVVPFPWALKLGVGRLRRSLGCGCREPRTFHVNFFRDGARRRGDPDE
jgi:hypothetical protein